MGVLYGVDVGDGFGVRSSATAYDDYEWDASTDASRGGSLEPSLDRLDAFASIVGSFGPYTCRQLSGGEVSLRAYTNRSADVFDVSMVTVAELIGDWPTSSLNALIPTQVDVSATMDASLSLDPAPVRDERLVPTRLAGFDVLDYVPFAGKAMAESSMLVKAKAQTGIGSIAQIRTFPDPRSVNLLATARWLPLSWSVDPWVTYWVPFSSAEPPPCPGFTVAEFAQQFTQVRQSVQWSVKSLTANGTYHVRPQSSISLDSAPGVNPRFDSKYAYYRDGGYVRSGAVSMYRGRHMWCDEVNWNAAEVTWIVVAVLHEPMAEWFGVLETEAPNTSGLEPFFGIRFHRTGVLNLWADSVLASTPLQSGITRPAQPVIIGLNIDMANNTVAMLSADTTVRVQSTGLPRRYDNRSRLWLGRSPFGADAAASMDILEVGYWEGKFGSGDLYSLVSQYDRMYGVTTS